MASGDKTCPAVALAAETLKPGLGGIARVTRLIARVLLEAQTQRLLRADALLLKDEPGSVDLPIAARAFSKSRLRFTAAVQAAALTHTHFIYDSVSMARAHNRLPLLRKPFLTFIHGVEVWEGARAEHLSWAHRADVLLTNTAATRDRGNALHGGLGHAPVCWLATETDDESEIPSQRDGPPTVLLLGRMDEYKYKGHVEMMQCWPQVVAAVPDAKLIFVGHGPSIDYWRKEAAASPVAKNVEVLGFVPDEQMPQIWARTSLLAMPSRGEGFGLVYIEAMRHGIPVIATIHDSAKEINIDGQTGFNVDLSHPEQLPQRIIQMLTNRELSHRCGSAGRQRWREHFRYSAFRARFMPWLERLIAIGSTTRTSPRVENPEPL